MAVQTTLGWIFKSSLSLVEMKKCLDVLGPKPWSDGDSERHGDYLGGKLTEEAVARIYKVGDGFIVNLRFFSMQGEPVTQLAVSKERLINQVLPTVKARDVRLADPLD